MGLATRKKFWEIWGTWNAEDSLRQAFARKSGQKHPFNTIDFHWSSPARRTRNTSFSHQAWTPEFRIAQKCLLAPPVFRSDSWAEPFKDKHDALREVLSSLHKSDSKKVLLRLEHEAASWLEPCQQACFSGKQMIIERGLSTPRLCHVGRGIWNPPESVEWLHQKLGWLVWVQADVTLRGMTDCTSWKPASTEWLHWKLGWHLCPFLLAGRQVRHFATKPRPKLPTCLVKMLLLTNHPILKFLMPCTKQRADAERRHCMRKICSVVASNLSSGHMCYDAVGIDQN